MNKPQTKAALIRYLTEHPHLRWEYPEALVLATMKGKPLIEGRKFLRVQGGRFVFAKPDGDETYLGDAKASDFEFHDSHFAVKFPVEWKGSAEYRMRYFYLDEPAQVTSV